VRVILSEAKDLMPVASGDEVLRFAQDDEAERLDSDENILGTNRPRKAIPRAGDPAKSLPCVF
jgi:hypothetical protein